MTFNKKLFIDDFKKLGKFIVISIFLLMIIYIWFSVLDYFNRITGIRENYVSKYLTWGEILFIDVCKSNVCIHNRYFYGWILVGESIIWIVILVIVYTLTIRWFK